MIQNMTTGSPAKLILAFGIPVLIGNLFQQLYNISKEYCQDCYLVEDYQELQKEWFGGKKLCGVSAGASTPNWIIDKIVQTIQKY